jgi:hypothetical protein
LEGNWKKWRFLEWNILGRINNNIEFGKQHCRSLCIKFDDSISGGEHDNVSREHSTWNVAKPFPTFYLMKCKV